MQGLRAIGVEVSADDDRRALALATGRLRHALQRRIDALPLALYRDRKHTSFSVNWFPEVTSADWTQRADLVHLHWVGAGLLPVRALLRIKKPVLWTLHDMWPFTGGCHYDEGCGRYTDRCGACPQLRASVENDLSRRVWSRKHTYWISVPLTIASPSRWLADEARKSSLFANARIEIIPNGLDLSVFKPLDKRRAREALGLPQDCRLVLFGAMDATSDPRKGYGVLLEALNRIAATTGRIDMHLVVFGDGTPMEPAGPGLVVHHIGRLSDDALLADLYAGADVMVVPSMQENLPNTIMEALACGTPVVAFGIGGIPDMIDHRQNGYLAASSSSEDLAAGIVWVLEDDARWVALSRAARRKCETHYDLKLVARKYRDLYEQLVDGAIR